MSTTREYNNATVSLYSEYGTQDKYNTLFASKLPDTVPSMNFPTILEQNTFKPYGYNSLTHDSDGTGYYTVKTGYSKDCDPKYNTVKCPQNRVLRPFAPDPKHYISPSACPIENQYVSEGFANDPLSLVKQLKLSFYYNLKTCPHSQKLFNEMVSTIGIENVKKYVQLKDVSIPANEQEMTNYGGYAIPFVYSHTTNNNVTGYYPLDTLFKQLLGTKSTNKVPSRADPLLTKIIDLDLIIYVLENCIYCKKVKELFKDFINHIKIIDASDPKVKDQVKNFPGFPVILSNKTKKHKLGLPKSIDDIIKELS